MTNLEIVDIVWNHLHGSALDTAVSGDVYKHRRAPNSTAEDVVINCLPINNEQISKTIANVNIHVPDIDVMMNGLTEKHPNHARLMELANIAMPLLKDKWFDTYHFDVEQQTLIQDREAGDHYINFRIEFIIENL